MANMIRLLLKTQRYWVRIPAVSDVCRRGCAYIVLQAVQRTGVCSAAYSIVHYNKSWKLRKKIRQLRIGGGERIHNYNCNERLGARRVERY